MKNLFFALTAMFVMASCSKKDAPVTPPVNSGTLKLTRVHHQYGANPAEVNDYIYDEQGRLIKFAQEEQYTEYSYAVPGKIRVVGRKTADNSIYQTGEVLLDPQGRITKMEYFNPSNVLTFTYNFTYDTEGYINNVKGAGTNYNFEHEFQIVNGNPVSVKYYNNGVHTKNGYYTYDGNIPNKMPGGHVSHWPSNSEFGKKSKSLCTEYREVDLANVTTWHYKYQYELDPAGFIMKRFGNNQLTGIQAVTTYTMK